MLFLRYFILLILSENEKVFFTAAQPVMLDPSNQLKKPQPTDTLQVRNKKRKKKGKKRKKSIHVVTAYLESYCLQPLIENENIWGFNYS